MVVCFMRYNCYTLFQVLVLQKSNNNELQYAVHQTSALFQICASLDFVYLCALDMDYAISSV